MTLMNQGKLNETKVSKVKLFQCSGYGDCHMVFTRNEHLARHTRKHTGEKPFQCIISGCDRMFSRYDNMMQHTQTHNKSRKPRRKSDADRKTDCSTNKKHEDRRLSIQELSKSTVDQDRDKYSRFWNVL